MLLSVYQNAVYSFTSNVFLETFPKFVNFAKQYQRIGINPN